MYKKGKRKTDKHNEKTSGRKARSAGKNKAVMYEVDDFDDSGETGLDMGLGGRKFSLASRHRAIELSMPLEERLKRDRSERGKAQNEAAAQLKRPAGEGVSREVSYVPRDTRKVDGATKIL